jgi:hypothetical protein
MATKSKGTAKGSPAAKSPAAAKPAPKAVAKAAPAPKGKAAAAPAKTAAKAKPAKKAGVTKGSKYSCSVCGLVVSVDTACGCAEAAHIVCCSKPMKAKK